MSRGPPLRRTLTEAIPIAQQRGNIQMVGHMSEKLYDFSIVSVIPLAFIRVSHCKQIHATVSEITEEFKDELLKLVMITAHDAVSRELWLRSRHGRWRFFRLAGRDLIELGHDGHLLPGNVTA